MFIFCNDSIDTSLGNYDVNSNHYKMVSCRGYILYFCYEQTQSSMIGQIKYPEVESKIIVIRNLEVIADADVAALFGVPTKEVNQAVKKQSGKV